MGYQELQRVTRGYNGVSRVYKVLQGLQGFTDG